MGIVQGNLLLYFDAALANGGVGPGLNSPLTTTFKDLSGLGNNGTLTNFTTYTFGDKINESGTTLTNLANVKAGSKFTNVLTCSVTSLYAYLANTGTNHAACNVKGLIYADSGGTPGALVAATNAKAIADNTAAGWQQLSFSSAVNLTPGNYWLCIIGDATATGLIFYSTSGGISAQNSDTYSDDPSDPFGVPTTGTLKCSIYANCTNNPQAGSGYAGSGTLADPNRLVFAGDNDYVALPALHACDDKVFTYEVWYMRSGAPSTTGDLITEANAANANAYPHVRMFVYTDGKPHLLVVDANAANINLSGPTSICDGAVHHIVGTGDGTYARLYVDGSLVAGPAAMPSGAIGPTGWTTVGGGRFSSTGYLSYSLTGGLAVARIYDRTLSDAEVATNTAAGYTLLPRGGGRFLRLPGGVIR